MHTTNSGKGGLAANLLMACMAALSGYTGTAPPLEAPPDGTTGGGALGILLVCGVGSGFFAGFFSEVSFK